MPGYFSLYSRISIHHMWRLQLARMYWSRIFSIFQYIICEGCSSGGVPTIPPPHISIHHMWRLQTGQSRPEIAECRISIHHMWRLQSLQPIHLLPSPPISIHHMWRLQLERGETIFIPEGFQYIICEGCSYRWKWYCVSIKIFQYIICEGCRRHCSGIGAGSGNFNTSYVKVAVVNNPSLDYEDPDFNTSYVKVAVVNNPSLDYEDPDFNTSYVKVAGRFGPMPPGIPTDFNTSYVKVAESCIRNYTHMCSISIHHMWRLQADKSRHWCSFICISIHHMWRLQPLQRPLVCRRFLNFNTSYVKVAGNACCAAGWPDWISIHHMWRLQASGTSFFFPFGHISIHHMWRLQRFNACNCWPLC